MSPGLDRTSTTRPVTGEWTDRKSTRLNSSHGYISYAVFCLKKKKRIHALPDPRDQLPPHPTPPPRPHPPIRRRDPPGSARHPHRTALLPALPPTPCRVADTQ